jgi:hypothetical protein
LDEMNHNAEKIQGLSSREVVFVDNPLLAKML